MTNPKDQRRNYPFVFTLSHLGAFSNVLVKKMGGGGVDHWFFNIGRQNTNHKWVDTPGGKM